MINTDRTPPNIPDYENNLAFAPTSADELNEQGRQSEVLIKALEMCQKLEQEIKKYKTILFCIDSERLPAGCYKADYEHSMKSINWVFENMLDDEFNPIEKLDK